MAGPWVKTTLAERTDWAEGLASFTLATELSPFEPGQFVLLGLELDGRRVERPYTLASAPGQPPAVLLSLVPEGALTPSLFALRPDDELWMTTRPGGQFTLRWVQDAPVLWLFATGTGIAPYVSMLATEEPWQRFGRIVVVHGARRPEHLAYREFFASRAAAHPGVGFAWIPVLSRAPGTPGVLSGRIPARLDDGQVERCAGAGITRETAQVMLCGNPGMIHEVRAILEGRGLARNRMRAPGQITTESFW